MVPQTQFTTRRQVTELIDLIFAIAKSRLPVSATTEAADQFAVVKRIVRAVRANPPKVLTPNGQMVLDANLYWSVSDAGKTLNAFGASYGVGALSLICELIELHPMRMAAAIPRMGMTSLAMLNEWKVPSENRTYCVIGSPLHLSCDFGC